MICALLGCGGATEIGGSADGGGPVEGGDSAGGGSVHVAGSHLTAPDVTFRPDACEVELKWSQSEVISGAMNGETGDLTLRLAGDGGHGTIDFCRYWACSSGCASGQWAVDAQR